MKKEKNEQENVEGFEIKETNDDGKLIRISKSAEEVLSELLLQINKSDDNLKVSKWSLASYIIEKYCPRFNDEDLKDLYLKSVTDLDLFKSAYKKIMETGVIPENLRDLLYLNAGLNPGPKKHKSHRHTKGSNATLKGKDNNESRTI
ncbi:MAG: hypothetical protein KDD45_09325 [Bdellovibrionales bacterium]|nr:hypothetical protein [Bdellovibrionales bacterium]